MAGRTRRAWTADDDARLTALWTSGAPMAAIEVELDRDESLIRQHLKLLRLPERKRGPKASPTPKAKIVTLKAAEASSSWPDAALETLKAMLADRKSASEIGAAIGKSRNAVLGKIHRLGLAEPLTIGPRVKPEPRKAANGAPARIARKAARYGKSGVEGGAPGFAALRAGPPKPPSLALVEAPEPDSALAVPFAERLSSQCCWPLWRGEPPLGERLVCGAPVRPGHGHPYCAHHLARSAQAPRMAPKAQADERTAA